eukprot:2546471-Prymnesium_polylepis.2
MLRVAGATCRESQFGGWRLASPLESVDGDLGSLAREAMMIQHTVWARGPRFCTSVAREAPRHDACSCLCERDHPLAARC